MSRSARVLPSLLLGTALAGQAAGGAVPEPATTLEPCAVAVTAWTLLEVAAHGSTLRVGPERHRVQQAAKWLVQQQDEQGRFGWNNAPQNARNQALATLAMAEVFTLSENYRPYRRPVIDGAHAVIAALLADGEHGTSPELAAIATLLLRTLQQANLGEPGGELAIALQRSKLRPPSSPAELAAEVLLRRLRRQRLPPDARFDRLWPKDLAAEPFAILYLALASYSKEPEVWDQRRRRLEPLVQAVAPRALAPFEAPGAGARLDDVTAAVQRLTRSLYFNADQLACLRGF